MPFELRHVNVYLLRDGDHFSLIDTGLLRADLRFEIGDTRLRLLELGLSLVDRSAVVARIDAYQRCACRHQLIIGDGHVDNGASNLGADRHRAGIDKGVVG